MTDPKHPALLAAERDRQIEELNARLADLELQAERRPALRKVVDRIAEIDRQYMERP